MSHLSFSLSLVVDQSNVNKITIITEPKVEGAPIARMIGALASVLDGLADGAYTLAFSSESGLTVEGPDARGSRLIKGILADDVAVLHGQFVDEMRDFPGDEELVENAATVVAESVVDKGNVAYFKPGVTQFVFGTPDQLEPYLQSSRLQYLLRQQEVDTDEEACVGRAAEIERLAAIPGLPEAVPFRFLGSDQLGGTFVAARNAALAHRFASLVPRIERRAAELLYQHYACQYAEAALAQPTLQDAFGLHP